MERQRLLQFYGDGTGRRIGWRLFEQAVSRRNSAFQPLPRGVG
jgi:hypothetical protein